MINKVSQIIANMTLEEKAQLCTGAGSWTTKSFEHLGIPSIVMSDGTCGVRFQTDSEKVNEIDFYKSVTEGSFDNEEAVKNTHPATCFPSGSSIACSWDTELIESVGQAIAGECRRLGINLLLGPGLNTRRHPLAARGFEYFSEDPCLSGDLAAAIVGGVQSKGVGTCVKHFICNNSEYQRTKMDSIVEERAVHEIYLAGFERVVRKAKPTAVMGAYNKLNGEQASESKYLLTDILKKAWGFEGMVISDWGSVKDPVKAAEAGLDLQMPYSSSCVSGLIDAVKKKELDEGVLDEKCRRILEVVFKLKSLEKGKPEVDFDKHHELARKAATESAVLLKNEDGILPISFSEGSKITVLGNIAVNPRYQGTGCAIINSKKVDNPLEEIIKMAGNGMDVRYSDGYDENDETNEKMIEEAVKIAKDSDAVIIFAGVAVVLEAEPNYNRKHMDVEKSHIRLIEAVSGVNDNIIVVLQNGETVTIPWLSKAKGVLEVWFNGQGGGNSIAELLFGKANPSGKLAVSIPKKLSDTPAFLNFPGENGKHYYNEGIFAGYRYYDKKKIEPEFPFGFGLSYTTFEYSDLKCSKKIMKDTEKLEVTVTVTNKGKCCGKEIVQLYVSDKESKLKRPIRELKAFKKIYLHPNESKSVSFSLEYRDFAYYDPDLSDWVVETGEFEILIGKSSRDICLREIVFIESHKKHYNKIFTDTLFYELFQNEKARRMFLDFLVENKLVEEDKLDDKLVGSLSDMFWGMAVAMDMFSGDAATKEMVQELVDKINAGCIPDNTRKMCNNRGGKNEYE